MNKQQTGRQSTIPPRGPRDDESAQAFPDEAAHLAEISGLLESSLRDAQQSVERMDKEYNDAKRYMAQNRGEIDPHEMFQNELALREIDGSGAFAVEVRDKLAKLKDSPYFARIDFREAGDKSAVPYYIGRFSYSREAELLIFDWRAPVAGMFYDCEVGPAGYTAPRGDIKGALTRKRQFSIKKGELEYVLESSVNVQDDVLQRELSHTSDERMKSIIATIQREQNQIIRNERAKTLIIQGVAGSGKTSIALHRVAFLLYRFKDRLAAQNVTILSPNRVFGDYISNVLPELGEEPIFGVSMADIAEVQLEGVIGFAPDRDLIEDEDKPWAARVQFKSTLDFVREMDGYIERMADRVFAAEDYVFGSFTAPGGWIRTRYDAYGKHPVMKRLQMVADDIYERFIDENRFEEELPKLRSILKKLKDMLRTKNTLALYKDFYRQIGRAKMLVMPGRRTLEWNDVFPFLYLHAAFEGVRESPVIRHLVIDEMQDYTPIQFAVLGRLFPCRKTILGDFSQRVNPNHCHSLEDIRALHEGAVFVELNTSYRSTYEIISFARKVQPSAKPDPIRRHGEAPQVLGFDGPKEQLDWLCRAIREFAQSGYASLGVIAKTNADAQRLYDALRGEGGVHLIAPDSRNFESGVSITSVQMAKGLEFDQLIIPDADSAHYHTEQDRALLYVACTRAMHRLDLLYCGKPSKFIA